MKQKILALECIDAHSIRQVQHNLLTPNECTVLIRRSRVRVLATAEEISAAIEPFVKARIEKARKAKERAEKKKAKKKKV